MLQYMNVFSLCVSSPSLFFIMYEYTHMYRYTQLFRNILRPETDMLGYLPLLLSTVVSLIGSLSSNLELAISIRMDCHELLGFACPHPRCWNYKYKEVYQAFHIVRGN